MTDFLTNPPAGVLLDGQGGPLEGLGAKYPLWGASGLIRQFTMSKITYPSNAYDILAVAGRNAGPQSLCLRKHPRLFTYRVRA